MRKFLNEVSELFGYKELLRNLVSRDIKKRYKRSALGFLWVMLDPLFMLLIFYVVFGHVFGKTVGKYTPYAMAGITLWKLFSQSTSASVTSFIANRQLINKLYLPRSIFPVSVMMSALTHFAFSLIPLFLILILSHTQFGYPILLLPLVVGLLTVFSLGLALVFSTLAVFFYDIVYIYNVLLLAWMYLSAIFYPVSIIPENIRFLLTLNPIYHYISLFRACLYDREIPIAGHLAYGAAFAVLSLALGWIVYSRNKDRLVFYL
jgi:ABC-type polysaccharide/polyol phosphate export permease